MNFNDLIGITSKTTRKTIMKYLPQLLVMFSLMYETWVINNKLLCLNVLLVGTRKVKGNKIRPID